MIEGNIAKELMNHSLEVEGYLRTPSKHKAAVKETKRKAFLQVVDIIRQQREHEKYFNREVRERKASSLAGIASRGVSFNSFNDGYFSYDLKTEQAAEERRHKAFKAQLDVLTRADSDRRKLQEKYNDFGLGILKNAVSTATASA